MDSKYLNHGDSILVTYSCRQDTQSRSPKKLIGVDVVLSDRDYSDGPPEVVFVETWPCDHHADVVATRYRRIVVTFASRALRFRPDLINHVYYPHIKATIRIWIAYSSQVKRMRYIRSDVFGVALEKSQVEVDIKPPFSRPSILATVCLGFSESVRLLRFPMSLSENTYGKIGELRPYSNQVLEMKRINELRNFQFSFVFWIYLDSHCTYTFCAIFQRFDRNSKRYTPNLFINNNGALFVEVYDIHGSPEAAITLYQLPVREWCRLVFHFTTRKWELKANCRSNFGKTNYADYIFKNEVYYDDVEPLSIIGGSHMFISFRGYITKFTIYRRHLVRLKDIEKVSDDDFMFLLDTTKWSQTCRNAIEPIEYYMSRLKQIDSKKKCISIESIFRQKPKFIEQCAKKIDINLYKTLRSLAMSSATNILIGKSLYSLAIDEVNQNGFNRLDRIIDYLNKSSCFGNHMSSYMLSTFYLHGLGLKQSNQMSVVYLMMGALNSDRLSLLALGSKHFRNDEDEHQSQDYDLSYYYYIRIAKIALYEFYNPIEDENYPYLARLSDRHDMEMITNEEGGDLFEWLRDQAKKGVASAQNSLANLLYWGTQGVKRNIDAVVKMYKIGAENKDPKATFNYGLSLLKGLGTEKNINLARENFEASAKLGHSTAFAALGYHAFEIEKNRTKAAYYWLEGWETKRDVDCAFNLGYLWSEGLYLNEPKNLKKAWEYWSYAAVRGQIDAQVKVAEFNSKGLGFIARNAELAAIWGRYVGEKSSIVGKCLNEGVLAFKNKNWELSILYYLMTASTGIEVGCFNLAYLCELNPAGLISAYLNQTECMYKYYNQSIYSDVNNANSYALIKMADFHYYKSKQTNDSHHLNKAIELYALAYRRGETQGLFSLAQLIEIGVRLPATTWQHIRLASVQDLSIYDQISEIYKL